MTIHISNLKKNTSKTDILDMFSGYNIISVGQVRYIANIHTRIATGYAFVEIEEPAAGNDVIQRLNGSLLAGNKIAVKAAQ